MSSHWARAAVVSQACWHRAHGRMAQPWARGAPPTGLFPALWIPTRPAARGCFWFRCRCAGEGRRVGVLRGQCGSVGSAGVLWGQCAVQPGCSQLPPCVCGACVYAYEEAHATSTDHPNPPTHPTNPQYSNALAGGELLICGWMVRCAALLVGGHL